VAHLEGAAIAHVGGTLELDLARITVRELNRYLHREMLQAPPAKVVIHNPAGAHAIACGLDAPVAVEIHGHVGYYAAGMNQQAHLIIHGNAGPGAAENMMSGSVRVRGFASTGAGASAHGGCLTIEGDAALRCGISLKGADIVVGGSVGSFAAFMAQAGRLVICGDAGDALGDSLYEAVIYVRGSVKSLGADARFEPLSAQDVQSIAGLLGTARFDHDPTQFRRVASARQLYHWNADAHAQY
jgi:glutamate synthase domain-containing protein 3